MKVRDIKMMVEAVGMTVVETVYNTHWKVRVARADGTEALVTFPASWADTRAMKNKQSQLRRIANGGSP